MQMSLESINFYYIIILLTSINVHIHNHLLHAALFSVWFCCQCLLDTCQIDDVFSEVAVHQPLLVTLVKAV